MDESGAVSQKQTDRIGPGTPAAHTEWLATILAPRTPLVITKKRNWSFASELCPLAPFADGFLLLKL